MASTFGSINIAYTALVAQRRGLDVAGQNVANANTAGYSRQRVEMESVGVGSVPARFSTDDGVGGGVRVRDVRRVHDDFLAGRAQVEAGRLAAVTQQSTTLGRIEDILKEPSDDGLQSQLEDMWDAWHEVAKNPAEASLRSALLQRATTVTDTLRSARGALQEQWSEDRTQLAATVDEVNSTAQVIAELNVAIRRAEQGGLSSNDLQDQRDLLVTKLSQHVGATSRPNDDGTVDVYLGGSALVRAASAEKLVLAGATQPAAATSDPVRVLRQSDGQPAGLTSGKGASLLESLTTTLPDYTARLDGLAAAIAKQVNDLHKTGYDQVVNASDPATGGDGNPFFGTDDGSATVTAANLTVVLTAPDQVAVSKFQGSLDNSVANAIAVLGTSTGGPDKLYKSIVVDLGVAAQTADRRATVQATVSDTADQARDAVSGVDIDEEMTNMIMFQHAYEAAARVMTSIDQMLDTLINHTGQAGRA